MKNKLLLVAAVALVLVVVFQSEDKKEVKASSPASVSVPSAKALNEVINRHMQDFELKKDIKRMHAELEWEDNQAKMPSAIPEEGEKPQVMDASVYDHASKVYADLNPDEKGIRTVLPSERIQSKLANRQWLKEYDQETRRQYIYAFIDNMRKDGFNVKLNNNLEVVGVERFRPSTLNLDQVIEKNQ